MQFTAHDWYKFFSDQGSLIGGLLTLAAAGLAYTAVRAQTSVAEKQIETSQAIAAKERVRSSFIANNLMLAAMRSINSDFERLLAHIEGHYSESYSTVPADFRDGIFLPEISTVWFSLGLCEEQEIQLYLQFNTELRIYKSTSIDRADWHKGRITILQGLSANLLQRFFDAVGRVQHRLAQLSNG